MADNDNPLHSALDNTDRLILAAIVLVGLAAVALAVYQNRETFVNWRRGFVEGAEDGAAELRAELRQEEGLPADG